MCFFLLLGQLGLVVARDLCVDFESWVCGVLGLRRSDCLRAGEIGPCLLNCKGLRSGRCEWFCTPSACMCLDSVAGEFCNERV